MECKEIPGLYIYHDVFSIEDEQKYIKYLEQENKNPNIVEQVHTATQYGKAFDKKKSDKIYELPEWIKEIWKTTAEHINIINKENKYDIAELINTDNVLINIYKPGDGCIDHFDDFLFWKSNIIGVSFGSGCTMEFKKEQSVVKIYLPSRSVYILSKDAQYNWTHGITFVDRDPYYGNTIMRDIRYSLTFREIHDDYICN